MRVKFFTLDHKKNSAKRYGLKARTIKQHSNHHLNISLAKNKLELCAIVSFSPTILMGLAGGAIFHKSSRRSPLQIWMNRMRLNWA
jgi:hypothetical protein